MMTTSARLGYGTRGVQRPAAGVAQPLARPALNIEAHDFVTLPEQRLGHRAAHDAEPYHPDRWFHFRIPGSRPGLH